MFAEVLVLDAFNKTPISLDPVEQYTYYLTFDSYVQNSTATFTYKVPNEVVGGEYTLKATSYNYISPSIKKIRIRDYPRDMIRIETNLPFE
jgi:hypothetical protein